MKIIRLPNITTNRRNVIIDCGYTIFLTEKPLHVKLVNISIYDLYGIRYEYSGPYELIKPLENLFIVHNLNERFIAEYEYNPFINANLMWKN